MVWNYYIRNVIVFYADLKINNTSTNEQLLIAKRAPH